MVAEVTAVPPAQYKQWLVNKKAEIVAADKAAEVRRAQEAKLLAPAGGGS
jgi:hypothetical protein